MTNPDLGRRTPTAIHVLTGALLASTVLYLVPALALAGQMLHAAVAAGASLGIVALWLLYRRETRSVLDGARAERRAHVLHRALLDHGAEAHLVLDPDGAVVFASPNTRAVLSMDPERLEGKDGLVDLVREHDRRRALHAFASVRRQPGLSVSLDVGGWHPDGSDCFMDVRITNLVESPSVAGILVTLRDITPRKTFESEIQHLAYYDALTGLANRRFFFEQGEKALSLARRHRDAAAVFYIDLDEFKQVNDTLGHERGDELLQRVAEGLKDALRDTDIVARLGGDEFAVILTEVRDEEAASRVAHRIRETLPSILSADGHEIPVGASVGVALFPEDGGDLESLLKAADLAMYRAKTDGIGVQFYRPELRTAFSERLRLEQDLKRGLEGHEFHLYYQPVFHLMTGQMVGAEALSRWRHFARGLVVASEFIQLAERSGLVRSLDRWAIARAIQQRSTQADGDWIGWVAVNLSPQSVSDPHLPRYIRESLEAAGLPPGSLVLELPEGAVLQDTEAAADLMWELKNMGAAIALDNFGMGPTSFSRLKRLPIDILKLHSDFVSGIGGDEGDEHLVEATIAIAHGIRAKVLAKGVERDDQVVWLREAGCDFIQGNLMGAPVPVADLNRRVKTEI